MKVGTVLKIRDVGVSAACNADVHAVAMKFFGPVLLIVGFTSDNSVRVICWDTIQVMHNSYLRNIYEVIS